MHTPSEARRVVLLLYAVVGPVFCASLLVLGRWREDPRPLAAVVALIGGGALWLLLRRSPRLLDWIFPVAVAPVLCCAIGFVACGDRGTVYLAVMGAPLAWAAVLFDLPVVLAALATAVLAVFVALSARLGASAAAASTLLLSPVAGSAAWVVFVTARRLREARRELAESEQRHRSVIAAAAEGIVMRRADGSISAFNPAAERLLGVDAMQVQGQKPIDPRWHTIREDGTVLDVDERPNRAVLRTGKPVRDFTLGVQKPDGSVTWLSVNAQPIFRDGENVPDAVVAAYRDVTEQRRQAQELLVATRLASVGTLAAGVAHEINNPLAWVTSNLRFAMEALPADEGAASPRGAGELREALDEALQGAERIACIVKAMRSLGRPVEAEQPHEIDVAAELQNAIQMVRNQLVQRARLEVQVAPELPLMRARTNELGRVFLNVLMNAAQAIPEGRASENRILVAARVQGGEILVEVTDTGVGIPGHVQPRIFEPFFTTKPVGVGTGLGLSIARSIMEGAGGRIEFESDAGRGATFRVRVPVDTATTPIDGVSRAGAGEGRVESCPARRRVLVIDDEPLVRRALERVLSGVHDVTTLESAAEALGRLDAGERWDAIFCDLMLPDLDGVAFYEALAARGSNALARLAFVTGGAFGERTTRFLAEHDVVTVAKPVEAAELVALAERLAQAGDYGAPPRPATAS